MNWERTRLTGLCCRERAAPRAKTATQETGQQRLSAQASGAPLWSSAMLLFALPPRRENVKRLTETAVARVLHLILQFTRVEIEDNNTAEERGQPADLAPSVGAERRGLGNGARNADGLGKAGTG